VLDISSTVPYRAYDGVGPSPHQGDTHDQCRRIQQTAPRRPTSGRAADAAEHPAGQREVDAYNRRVDAANKKAVDDYNRRAEAHNRKVVADHNRQVDDHNRRAKAHNDKVIADINRRLAAAGRPQVRYTPQDQALVERVQDAIPFDDRDYDVFLNYARIDGADVAGDLSRHLQDLGISVWYDAIAIRPGKSQSLQMDQGLRKARASVAVLTPAYLTGRFWVERELGALLGKETLIPVLHGVTFADVKEYSGILPDLAGFETARDSIADIAAKIAAAVTPPAEEAAS
jgi:hypothetical protein